MLSPHTVASPGPPSAGTAPNFAWVWEKGKSKKERRYPNKCSVAFTDRNTIQLKKTPCHENTVDAGDISAFSKHGTVHEHRKLPIAKLHHISNDGDDDDDNDDVVVVDDDDDHNNNDNNGDDDGDDDADVLQPYLVEYLRAFIGVR